MTRKDFHCSLSNRYYKALFMFESNLPQLLITGKKKHNIVMSFLSLSSSPSCSTKIFCLLGQHIYTESSKQLSIPLLASSQNCFLVCVWIPLGHLPWEDPLFLDGGKQHRQLLSLYPTLCTCSLPCPAGRSGRGFEMLPLSHKVPSWRAVNQLDIQRFKKTGPQPWQHSSFCLSCDLVDSI